MKKILKIAVRDLVAHVMRTGDLAFEFLSSSRPVEAIRIHQKIQQSRPDNYQSEVAVSRSVESELFTLAIGGRIDGVQVFSDRILIEEIKTTTRGLDYFQHHEDAVHWGQLKSYAYLYAKDHHLVELDAQLTYYQVDTGKIVSFQKHFMLVELESFFQDLVARYLQWAQTIVRWQQARDASIRRLKFPFSHYRPGQREMAVGIYRAIKNETQLLVQAATGIGKTMAAVFSAVKAMGEGISSKIFYLTARTTGRIAAEKALDELRKKGLKLKSLTITAKEKICFSPDSACNPDECEFARGYYDRLNGALEDIFFQDAFTREVLEQAARSHRICPFEFSLELSLWAECIICDYNYAFDPRVFLRRFFLEETGNYTFLIDEAHNLVDRSREMFSAELYKQPLLDVRRAVRGELPAVYKSLGKINSWMIKAGKNSDTAGPVWHEKEPPDALFPLLRKFLRITEHWLSRNLKAGFRDTLLDLYFKISGFMRVAEQYDECYATCYEKIKKDLKLKLFCIDPSIGLKNALTRCKAAVFFSATMTPMTYFQKILGCNKSAAHLKLTSPFPAENLGLFVSNRLSTLYRQRQSTRHLVSRAICTFISQKKGNYLIFFPSYEYLQMVLDTFKSDCPDSETIVQTPAMSELERNAFLERFSQDNPASLLGFAVMGGIFGEGIDLVGDRLSGAVVVGVGLPGICLERELIREYFAATLKAGFEFAYQYPGINRVLQAAGRVIRSEIDRGAVLLIDQRYATYRYRALLLPEWNPIQVKNEAQFADDLQKFWNAKINDNQIIDN
ncbi:MAG: ATP-dependent DNA helicase [Desulfobacterales bacterium]